MKLTPPPDVVYDEELKNWLHKLAVTANREGGVVTVDIANARVGIGVTAPSAALDVNGAIELAGNLTTAMGSSPYIGTTDAYGVNIGADSTTRIRIAAAGNVGINMSTSDPTHGTLEVTGTIYASGDISALTFTDRTAFYEGDAIKDLSQISGKDGQIDHDTLPEFARSAHGRDLGAMVSILIEAIKQLDKRVKVLESR